MHAFHHLVTLGGSITTGYAASDLRLRSWAALVAAELARTGPTDFHWTNRGVSGTDSVSGALRVATHAQGADLVVVEQAVNDQWLDPNVAPASYEGLLRQLLTLTPRPIVVCLLLGERGGAISHASRIQQTLAEYYGLTWVRPELGTRSDGSGGESFGSGDPIHPVDAGHARIAQAVLGALENGPARGPDVLPPALFGTDWQSPRAWTASSPAFWGGTGWRAGSDVHEEWHLHGGAPSGWTTDQDGAELVVEVEGTVIGVLISESEHYRNLEAWLDDGPPQILRGHRPDRVGYLGWSWHALSRQATAGVHRVHLRPAEDPWQGSGRPVHVVAVIASGASPVAQIVPRAAAGTGEAPRKLPLRSVGRLAPQGRSSLTLGWSLSSVAGTFRGSSLALDFENTHDRVVLRLTVDGQSQTFRLPEGPCTLVTRELGDDQHQFELVKLSEGLFGSTELSGLRLSARSGAPLWLTPPVKPRRRIEVYGDSITAGACNLDVGGDQYDDLASHDPTLTYVSLAARRWDADVVAIAVSGTGVTCSWNPVLLPDVADRWLPDSEAEVTPSDREPDLVLVNLGTNDLGFPQSQGLDLSPEYSRALVAFVRTLRQRHPGAWILGALGGIFAPDAAPDLRRQWRLAWATLAEGDARVRSFEFQSFAEGHPRVEAHARMADELLNVLNQEILL